MYLAHMTDRREVVIRAILANAETYLTEMEQEAYARGWNDAIQGIKLAAETIRPTLTNGKISYDVAAPTFINGGGSDRSETAPRPRGRPATAIAAILELIKQQPGLRGSEIVAKLAEAGNPVGDRTVRSALRRLKGQDVWQRSYRWYPKHTRGNTQVEEEAQKEFGEAVGSPPQ